MKSTGPASLLLRRAIYLAIPIGVAVATLFACGTDRPEAAGERTNPFAPDRCQTPNEGCDCPEPGASVACGQVERTSSDGFVECSMGRRTCLGTRWGGCVGEREIVTRSLAGGGGIGTRALGGGAACGADGGAGGPANPCDPYCNAFVDDPSGLPCVAGSVGLVDGGFGVCPNADAGAPDGGDGGGAAGLGGLAPTINTTATGNSTCPGGINLHGGPCTLANQFTTCQQDFRCDPTSLTCQWNGPNNYYDGNAGGADITVGAGCENGTEHLPVCNRGSVAVAAGATITVNLLTPAQLTVWNTGTCSTLAGPPDCSKLLAAPLNPGECVDIAGCALAGNAYAVVNMEAAAIPEAAGRCANNVAYVKPNGAPGCAACTMCNTTLTGKVYDPSGPAGNNLPLAGISVLEPAGTPPVFVDGVACDTCSSIEGPYIVKAVTDATGSFTINGATPGTATTVIAQSGRWRRKIQIPITACAANAPAAGTFRMPQSRTDGLGGQADIPKTAIVTEAQESLECLFRKMGVAAAEITSPTAAIPGRIHMFKNGGMSAPTATPAPATLYSTQAALDVYTASLYGCNGGSGAALQSATLAQGAIFAAHTGKGGKVLINHHSADRLFYLPNGPASFRGTSTFTAAGGPSNQKMLVKVGTPPQQQFYDWLSLNGGMLSYGPPYLRALDGDDQAVLATPAQTTTWLGGRTDQMWTGGPPPTNQDYVGSYSFEMGNVAGVPTVNADCGVVGGHGRVFFNGMHVSGARGTTSGTFPAACALGPGLTETEKALEFHIFQLTACQLGGSPPPPPPVPLPVVTYYRDYHAVCGAGERAKWAPFYWQSLIPAGTSVSFRAATADTQALLPASPPAAPPVTATVGTAASTVAAPTWDCQGCPITPVTVDSELLTDTATVSKEWLRIYMKFNPSGSVTPALTSWRQVYDCVPAE